MVHSIRTDRLQDHVTSVMSWWSRVCSFWKWFDGIQEQDIDCQLKTTHRWRTGIWSCPVIYTHSNKKPLLEPTTSYFSSHPLLFSSYTTVFRVCTIDFLVISDLHLRLMGITLKLFFVLFIPITVDDLVKNLWNACSFKIAWRSANLTYYIMQTLWQPCEQRFNSIVNSLSIANQWSSRLHALSRHLKTATNRPTTGNSYCYKADYINDIRAQVVLLTVPVEFQLIDLTRLNLLAWLTGIELIQTSLTGVDLHTHKTPSVGMYIRHPATVCRCHDIKTYNTCQWPVCKGRAAVGCLL